MYSQVEMFYNCSQSQPVRLMPWCLGMVLLMQAFVEAPAALTPCCESELAGSCTPVVPGDEDALYRDASGGKEMKGAKTMSFVQINSQLRKEHVEEEEEPPPDSNDEEIPNSNIAEVISPAGKHLKNKVLSGEGSSKRGFVAPAGDNSNSRPTASVSVHSEAVSLGPAHQRRASSVGAKLLLELKWASGLLQNRTALRLRQWHELVVNAHQQSSALVTLLYVAAGAIILIVTFVALSRGQATGHRRPARSDFSRPGPSRGLNERSQRGTLSKLPTAGLLPQRDSLPQALPQRPPTDSASQQSSMQRGGENAEELVDPDSYFCPDLVVPPGCECILKVPTASLSRGPFDVTDVNDNAVLHVEPRAINLRPSVTPGGKDAEQRQQHRLVLTTEYGTIMAQCGPSMTQARECVLLRAAGDHFAKITGTEEKAYTMTTRSGLKLFFWGSFEDHAMNVIDCSGRLIAKTGSISELPASGESISVGVPQSTQGAPIYRLRVAPLMDVGLVLCGLLCIQHLM